MLLAEDLALLLHDASGRAVTTPYTIDVVLAGAVLLELALHERLRVEAAPGTDGAGRLVPVGDGPVRDEVLDAGLAAVRTAPDGAPDRVLEALREGLRERVLDRLVGAGHLRRDERRVLGLLRRVRWRPVGGRRAEVLRSVETAIGPGAPDPDERTVAVVSLLVAADVLRRALPDADRDARDRAARLAEAPWAADAVRRAVEEVASVVMTTSIMVAAGS